MTSHSTKLFGLVGAGHMAVLDTIREDLTVLTQRNSATKETLLDRAASNGQFEMCKGLLELGADPNLDGKGYALESACSRNVELVDLLLSGGADPSLGRPLVRAINNKDASNRLEIVNRLIESGVDVNKVFEMFGDSNNLRTALDFASRKPDVADLLKANGAKRAEDLSSNIKN
jgi:ankyrin repeat protein